VLTLLLDYVLTAGFIRDRAMLAEIF